MSDICIWKLEHSLVLLISILLYDKKLCNFTV